MTESVFSFEAFIPFYFTIRYHIPKYRNHNRSETIQPQCHALLKCRSPPWVSNSRSFEEASGTTNPGTQPHTPEVLNPQLQRFLCLKSVSYVLLKRLWQHLAVAQLILPLFHSHSLCETRGYHTFGVMHVMNLKKYWKTRNVCNIRCCYRYITWHR
jgi:hypothetical protein